MTDIGFYHLTRSPLDEALPRLLEKAYAAGHRVVVRGGDPERIELLNRALWTYGKDSFLPHGARSDGFAEDQPIYLTAQVENPNGATILIRVDEAEAPDLDAFDRCLDLFDGHDEEAVGRARERWRQGRDAGHVCTYWQQGERGGWVKAG
ncbi:MAG: DNA polymerase III subunit chi [Geminicoccaceae bacterium]